MRLQFWQRAWRKGGWITRLFGMTLRPSTLDRGVERWISSLAATPVSRSPLPASAQEPRIRAIFGRTSRASSVSASPFRCSWRMLGDTFAWDSMPLPPSFEEWATTLRRVCLQRRKSARLTAERDSSFWQTPASGQYEKRRQVGQTTREELLLPGQAKAWQTPKVAPGDYSYPTNDHTKPFLNLPGQAKLWPTPHQNCVTGAGTGGRDGGLNLQTAAMWATPTSRDHKDGANPSENVPTNSLLGRQAPRSGIVGRLSSLGARRLNPLFVEWLMGWPRGWTDFEPVGTESFLSWQRTHTNLLRRLSG